MATETLNIVSIDSAFSDPNGAVTDIDEPISGADGNSYGTTTENDTADFGLTNPLLITDADTVNSVTITWRAQKGGTAGNERWQLDLLIGGVVQGTQQSTGNLTTSFANYAGINDAGWNSDWTLAQLQGMQVRATAIQAGMGGTQVTDIDCGDVIVDFTVATSFTPDFKASRFYADGTESGSSALAAQDTDIIVNTTAADQQVQLRLRVDETGGAAGASTDDYALEVSKNSGAYAAITASSSNVKADTASTLSDGSATTNRVTEGISDPGAGSFVAGEQEAANGVVEDRQLTADNFTEHVFAITVVRADVASGDTLDFRITLNAGAPGMANTVIPRIVVYETQTFVDFDGTDFLDTVDASSVSDGKLILYSGWVKPDSSATAPLALWGITNRRIRIGLGTKSGGNFSVIITGQNSGGSTILSAETTTFPVIGDQANHIQIGVDMVTQSNFYIWVNGVDETPTPATYTDDSLEWSRPDSFVGFDLDWNNIVGGKQEVYATNEYLSSAEANRRKFITANGKPVPLGSDGSEPTGTQPLYYLNNAFGSFETNKGSLGNFTVTGTLADEGTLPELPSVGAGAPVFMHHLKQMANN